MVNPEADLISDSILTETLFNSTLTAIWTYYQPSPEADPTIDIFFRDKMPFPERIEFTQLPFVVGWQRARSASGHWGLDGRWGPGCDQAS